MKLRDLHGEFLRYQPHWDTWTMHLPDGSYQLQSGMRPFCIHTERLEDAQGIKFLCPWCFKASDAWSGVHCITCWNRSVPLCIGPVGSGRWLFEGTGLDDLSLNLPISVSYGCGWHGQVMNGEVS